MIIFKYQMERVIIFNLDKIQKTQDKNLHKRSDNNYKKALKIELTTVVVLGYLVLVINKVQQILIKRIKFKIHLNNKYLISKIIRRLKKIKKLLNNYSFKL